MRRSILLLTLLALVLPALAAGECGNGRCEAGECDTCTADCQVANTDTCIGDGVCANTLGEDCFTSPADCACPGDQLCKRGTCSAITCGDGSCEAGESQTTCCQDCGCSAGEHCQNGACCPLSKKCCTLNEHCDVGEMCTVNRCTPAVSRDLVDGSNCTANEECTSGLCGAVADNTTVCCPRSEGCCRTASDCAEGYACTGFVCSMPEASASPRLIPGVPAGYEPYAALVLLVLVLGIIAAVKERPSEEKVAEDEKEEEDEAESENGEEKGADEGTEEEAEKKDEEKEEKVKPEKVAAHEEKREEVKRAIIMGEFTCPGCGKEINTDWKVCPYCSADLAGAPESSGATYIHEMDSLGADVKDALVRAFVELGLSPKDIAAFDDFDGDLIVVVSPDKMPRAEEVENLFSRVRAGAGLFLVGAGGADNSPLNRLAFKLGARFNADLVCDYEGENVTYMPFVNRTNHPITDGVNKLQLTASCSLDVQDSKDIVLYASQTSFADEDSNFIPDIDERKGYIVVMAARELGSGRVVLFGDANGLAQDDADTRILLRNTIAWLLRKEEDGEGQDGP